MIPLGIRNNNPFDLQADHLLWIGELPPAGTEAKFDTLADGIRAGVRVCYAYQLRLWNTPESFISHFAPGNGNPTQQYIENVCQWTGFASGQALDFHDDPTMVKWAQAIFRQELGEESASGISEGQILAGIALAQGDE